MAAASDYLENKVLDHVLGSLAMSQPTGLYLALSTVSFADDASGTELSGNGYARQAVTYGAALNGSISNDSAITFPTATGAWGLVGYIGVFDAATGGNLLYHDALSTAKQIDSGDTLSFGIGDLSVSLA